MAHIPLSDKAITLDEVNRLTAETPISIQTNTDGYEDKLRRIQQILKTSAELQLVIAAYYNELIINSNTDHPQTVANFNTKDFTWDSVTITKAGTPGTTFTLTKDGTFNIETATPPLAADWRTKKTRIETERLGILTANPTRPALRDGGRAFSLKSKKKKKKTSIKRR